MALDGRKVVLMEDNEQMADLLLDFLREEGFEVTRCSSIEEVWAALEAEPAALALCDDWSNEFSTLSDGHRAEIVELAARGPLVLVTGRAWASGVKGDELGKTVVLKKPFNLSGVIGALDRAQTRSMGTA